jgi:3-phosphoshikimate 1-carboxyvinyltransferase
MAFAIAGLFADGETTIEGTECVATSYPNFQETLEKMMREPGEPQTPVITGLRAS